MNRERALTIRMNRFSGWRICLSLMLMARVGCLLAATTAVTRPELALDAGWMLRSAEGLADDGAAISRPGYAARGWMPAVVPGTLLTTYVADGRYPDPYYGLNNKKERGLIPDASMPGTVFTFPHWYRNSFVAGSEYRGQTVWLELKGINWKADVWVNGVEVGRMAGMFKRGLFDITGAATVGTNGLAVKVYPLDHPGDARNPRAIGRNAATMIQTVGWDFTFIDGVRDRNIGIHRAVRVFAGGPVLVRDPFVATTSIPGATAELTLRTVLVNATDQAQSGTLVAEFAGGGVTEPVALGARETREIVLAARDHPGLVVRNPRLWWPVGRGKPELYDLRVAFVAADGTVSHEQRTTFGIRHLQTDTSFNHQLTFHVNGQRLFITGGNWVQDAMLRNTPKRYEAQVRYLAQAGVNLLRCWSGSGLEDDAFFEACDRYGILVWVESGLASQVQPPDDQPLHLANWRDAVLRVRGHPCVAYYCGANEGGDIAGMREVTMAADNTRGYMPNSQNFGERGNPYRYLGVNGVYDHTISDIWGPGPQGPLAGFNNESGAPCLPPFDCLREQMPADLLWPLNKEVFRYQDGGGFHRMVEFVQEGCASYGDFSQPDRAGRVGAENYAFKGQMLGAMLYRSLAEVWKRNKWDFGERKSGGYAFWTINTTQPQVCSRIYTYSLEPNAALYYLGHGNKPLHVQYDYWKNDVSVVNDLPQPATRLDVRAEIRNLDGRVVWHEVATTDVGPEANAIGVLKVPPKDEAGLDDVHFIQVELRGTAGDLLDSQLYWRARKDPKYGADGPFTALGDMPAAQLRATTALQARGGQHEMTVGLTNLTSHLAFFVRLKVGGRNLGRPVRPCFYGDNAFSILPGASRQVTVEYAAGDLAGDEPVLTVDGWNVGTCTVDVPGTGVTPDLPPAVKPRTNLALGKPITVSSTHASQSPGTAAAVVDGDRATRWSSAFRDPQWAAVDLGDRREIHRVLLRWDPAYARAFALQVADSPDGPWTTVREVTDGEGGVDDLPNLNATGRYVRLDLRERGSPWGYSLWEFEIYD